jgi:hypothetical protein
MASRTILAPTTILAAPGERVAVTLNEQRRVATASADGQWRVRLDNLAAGGPFR